ncbi:MAG: alpha/beta fold hydrolase [Isosphaeraceae bacterium]|nr:alpha/beta fold hydrolase [Isosphaeraceae bacterium]
MHLAPFVLITAAAFGWADITVQPSRGDRPLASWQRSIGGLDRPSERTVETLKRYDLERAFRRDPEQAIARLKNAARLHPESELVYALAELSWIEGLRLEGRRRWGARRGASALDRYLDTVAYAWDFLTEPELAAGRPASDPRYRLAFDLYNAGLDRLIRSARTKDRLLQPGDTIKLALHGREQAIRVVMSHSPWSASDIDELILCSDLEVGGLETLNHNYGLGVPLIGVRRTDHPGQGKDRFYPPEMAFPLTAVLYPNSRLRDTDDPDGVRACTLDLVDPVRHQRVGRGGEAVPLETDLTKPLAYMWSRTDLSRYRWTGLLRPGEAAGRAGLMLLRPYEPEKIPVVMVHGLASSPLAWIPMLNELLRDPQIQQRYQFLLYVYPTGVPIPIAAAGLRDALLEAQQAFDAPGADGDRPFHKMVLLGHSMGGLLSHCMVVSSGNQFWGLSTDRQFEDIIGPPEVLAELKRYNFFEPLPFVKRVVFLATPHRGSDLARRPVGRISASLISEPDHYSKLLTQLIKDNPEAFNRRRFRHLPTSIDTLEPDAPVLRAILAMTPAPDVAFHSIIGSLRAGGVSETTDGVVPYRSSHLDGVASELVVRSDHGVQKAPEAILEVRRILLLHAGVAASAAPRALTTSGTARTAR